MSIRKSALVGLALLSFGALRAPLAIAAEPTSSSSEADDKTRAREAMKKGVEAYRAKKYEEARIALERSFELRPSHDSAGVLGQVYVALGDHRNAANYLAYCVDHYPTAEKRELLERIEKDLKESAQRVLGLRVFANVNGSAVSVDGRAFGETPMNRRFLEPGEHTVVVTHPDGRSETRKVKGQAGQEVAVTVAFETVRASVAPVESGVDDEKSTTNGDEKPKETEAEPKTKAKSTAEDESSLKWPVVITTGALGVVGVGMGVGFLIDSNGKFDESKALGSDVCATSGPACDQYLGLVGQANDSMTISAVSFGAGGVLLATSVISYLLWPESKESVGSSAKYGVEPLAGGARFSVSGRF